MGGELQACDAVELASMIASGHVSPREALVSAFERLDAVEPEINAFSHVMRDEALEQSRQAESLRASGAALPPLLGVPISVKDLIAVDKAPLSFGSRVFAANRAAVDAPAVERLRAAGAIIIGKTTTSELGCKAVGDSPLTGITRNPWDTATTPGGSSAGAAASVAAGVTAAALGTDGGGSIRIPAALCGLIGFKAQYGRIPVHPRSATPGLAHVAPIARSVRDIALLLQVMAGPDERDPASIAQSSTGIVRAAAAGPLRLRIAWSPDFGYAKPDAAVLEVAKAALKTFGQLGCDIEEVPDPLGPDPADAWTLQFYAQVAARLGPSLRDAAGLIDSAVLPLLNECAARPSLAYAAALGTQRDVQEKLRVLFQRFDLLVSPTLPVAAVPAGVDIPAGQEGRNLVTWASYTYPFNLSGGPVASVPAGLTGSGHPVGLQIACRPCAEPDLVAACAAFEAARPWAKLAPMRQS